MRVKNVTIPALQHWDGHKREYVRCESRTSSHAYFNALRCNSQVMPEHYTMVKEQIPVVDAAQLYGFVPNRQGFICCPFHREQTPSLKFWPDHWFCFGCNEGGSVIDFVAKLYGLAPVDAVCKLNTDFSLNLPLGQPHTLQEQAETQQRRHKAEVWRRFEEWRGETLDQLCSAMRIGNEALKHSLDTWSREESEAVRWAAALEYWLDELEAGELDAHMSILDDWKGVEARCQDILGGTPLE